MEISACIRLTCDKSGYLSLLHLSDIIHDILYTTAVTAVDHKSAFKLTKDTTYLTLMDGLLCVCCEILRGNLLYNYVNAL